ncbi:ABC transporter ATP-binding protein [Desulfitobacterium sp. AusDCA]
MPLLEMKHVYKSFNSSRMKLTALQDINLSVHQEEFVCILGPSGCGKTTLLRMIAGLERQSEGSILLGGNQAGKPNHHRALVFQEPRLFPWLTVEANIVLGIQDKVDRRECHKIASDCLDWIGFDPRFLQAYPHELSGGMAQRVAIARALAVNPEILLLDEPFSSLDAITRRHLQAEIQRVWQQTGKTMIMVTHDIDEALRLGQRVIILSSAPGHIVSEFNLLNSTVEQRSQIKGQILNYLDA